MDTRRVLLPMYNLLYSLSSKLYILLQIFKPPFYNFEIITLVLPWLKSKYLVATILSISIVMSCYRLMYM